MPIDPFNRNAYANRQPGAMGRIQGLLSRPGAGEILLGLGQGLLSKSGYTTTPTSTGEAFGAGILGAQGAQQNIQRRKLLEAEQERQGRLDNLSERKFDANKAYMESQAAHQAGLLDDKGANRDFTAEQNALDRASAERRSQIGNQGLIAQLKAQQEQMKLFEMMRGQQDAQSQDHQDLIRFDSSMGEMQVLHDQIDSLTKRDDFERLTGPFDAAMARTPGTPQAGLRAEVANVTAQATLQTLANMKSQSRTGATGFGALSEKELSIIENGMAALSPENFYQLSTKDKLNQLNKVKENVRRVIDRMESERSANSKFQRIINSGVVSSGQAKNLNNTSNDPLDLGL